MKPTVVLASFVAISSFALAAIIIHKPAPNEDQCGTVITSYQDNLAKGWPNRPEMQRLKDECIKRYPSARALSEQLVLVQMAKANRCKPHQTLRECMADSE